MRPQRRQAPPARTWTASCPGTPAPTTSAPGHSRHPPDKPAANTPAPAWLPNRPRRLSARHFTGLPNTYICPALLPGSCPRGAGAGAGLVATGKSGAYAGFCLRTWRPGCGFRAVCVAAQALWSNISVRLHTPRRSTGRAPGGWKDSPSTTTAAAAPKPSPAAALFMLIGASPRIQWLQETIDCDQRGYALTGHDLAGAKPPPGAHHRSDVGLPLRRPHSWVAFNWPRSSGR